MTPHRGRVRCRAWVNSEKASTTTSSPKSWLPTCAGSMRPWSGGCSSTRRRPTDTLARHIGRVARQALSQAGDLTAKLAEANRIVAAIGEVTGRVVDDDHLLTAITRRPPAPSPVRFPPAPITPLSVGALLVNGRNQPQIGPRSSGAGLGRPRRPALRVHQVARRAGHRGAAPTSFIRTGRLRCGSSRRRTSAPPTAGPRPARRAGRRGQGVVRDADDPAARQGLAVPPRHRVLRRPTSARRTSPGAALLDGLEWNVRLSQRRAAVTCSTRSAATFDEYWDDPAFEAYDPARTPGALRLDEALAAERGDRATCRSSSSCLDVRP